MFVGLGQVNGKVGGVRIVVYEHRIADFMDLNFSYFVFRARLDDGEVMKFGCLRHGRLRRSFIKSEGRHIDVEISMCNVLPQSSISLVHRESCVLWR
jgi:hypothetical protein